MCYEFHAVNAPYSSPDAAYEFNGLPRLHKYALGSCAQGRHNRLDVASDLLRPESWTLLVCDNSVSVCLAVMTEFIGL